MPNDVIVDMRFINMRGDDKGMILFQKAGSKFVAHAVGFLGSQLDGRDGFPEGACPAIEMRHPVSLERVVLKIPLHGMR